MDKLSVRPRARGCIVSLVGADAGTSWKATLTTDLRRVTHRVVRSGEFPDEDWEETRYVQSFPPGM